MERDREGKKEAERRTEIERDREKGRQTEKDGDGERKNGMGDRQTEKKREGRESLRYT